MAIVTVRNLSQDVHRALKARAARNRRSIEAEIRAIPESAVLPSERVRPGALLAEVGRAAGMTDEDCLVFGQVRGKAPSEPMVFE